MENPEVTKVGTQQPTVNASTETKAPQVTNTPATGVSQKPDHMFSRQEVTKILKGRLDRYVNSVCSKYGVNSMKELDDLYEKHRNYDDLVTERDGLKTTNASLAEKVAFMENGIDPDRYDDIRTHFKGLGQTFDSGILGEVVKTHPEWVKKTVSDNVPKTTIQRVGSAQTTSPTESADARERRVFGDL